MNRHIIIGCGSAGISALRQIRRAACKDDILMVTMEDCSPYSPTSLPYLISRKIEMDSLPMVDNSFFKDMKADVLRGKKVTRIDPVRQEIGFADGCTERFDKLLIATGSEPIMDPRFAESGIQGFHTLKDFFRIEKTIEHDSFAILGAGLVGIELAVALLERGNAVSVIAPRERILRKYFDFEAGRYIIDILESHGISIRLGWGEAVKIERRSDKIKIDFKSGNFAEAGVAVACTGVKPRLSMVADSGIETRRGVVVDRTMRTNFSNIFAAGDVAEAPAFFSEQNGLSMILPSSVAQGKIAGRNMAGVHTVYDGWLPMNILNFFGNTAISVGMAEADASDEVLVSKNPKEGRYRKLILRNRKIVGATFLNETVDGGVFQYLIRNRIDIGRFKNELLEDPSCVALWFMLENENRESKPLDN